MNKSILWCTGEDLHYSLSHSRYSHMCMHACRQPRRDGRSTGPSLSAFDTLKLATWADTWPARQQQRQAHPCVHEAQAGQEWHHDLARALVLVQEAPGLRQLSIQVPTTGKLLQMRSCGGAGALVFGIESAAPPLPACSLSGQVATMSMLCHL